MFLTIAACRAPDLVPVTSLTNLTASLVDSRARWASMAPARRPSSVAIISSRPRTADSSESHSLRSRPNLVCPPVGLALVPTRAQRPFPDHADRRGLGQGDLGVHQVDRLAESLVLGVRHAVPRVRPEGERVFTSGAGES